MQNPCIDHWNIVMHILRYLKRVLGQGLLFKDKGNTLFKDKGNTEIAGYYHANWTDSPMCRHSTT